jgi:hypothetical protein
VYIFVRSIFFFFGTLVITQTQDIRTGVLAGNDAKETKVQKYKRLHKKKGILTKGLLENQPGRGGKKQGTRSCCLSE